MSVSGSVPSSLRTHRVTAPDGVRIAVREAGAAEGRPVVFIHGYSQAGLCWDRQMRDPALAHLRLVAYDLRGHGASDKPLDPAFYQDGTRWAGDLEAILKELDLHRPILVGWSYGGRIICDYLDAFGAGALAGVVFVDAITGGERAFYGTCNRLMRLMTEDEPEIAIAATRAFLRSCFHAAPDQEMFETLLAANMMVPPQVRAAMGRPAHYDGVLAALDRPALILHGQEDQVIALAMARHMASLMGGARLELWERTGHAPFLEHPERFNALLADFAAACP